MQNQNFISSHPVLITAAALSVVFSLFFFVKNLEQQETANEFQATANTYRLLMDSRMNELYITLDATKRLFEGSSFVDRGEFTSYVKAPLERMNDLQAFFWVPFFNESAREDIVNSDWNSGFGGKPVFDTDGRPSTSSLLSSLYYAPILYVKPSEFNQTLIGLNLASDTAIEALLNQARDDNAVVPISGPTASSIFLAPADSANFRRIVHLVQAVYVKGGKIETIGQRRANLLGYIIMQIDVGKTLEQTLTRSSPKGIDIYIVNVEAAPGEEMIFLHKSRISENSALLSYDDLWKAPLSSVTPLNISGSQWKIVMLPTAEFFELNKRYNALILLLSGLLLCAVLYKSLLSIHQRENEVRQLVKVRTTELQNSETRVRSIIDNVAEGIISINNKGLIETLNPAAEKIFGYEHDEIVGANINILIPKDERTEHDGFIKNSNLSAPRIINKTRALFGRRKSGEEFPIELNVSSMIIDGEQKFIGLMHDISDRKKAEEELRKVTQGLEQSADAVFITDKTGTIEYVNKKFIEFFGYTLEEVKGKNPRVLSSGKTPIEVYQDLWNSILSGHEWRGEIQDKCKDGKLIWASVTISPIRDDNGNSTHFVSSHSDITMRKEAEVALREALHKTEIANKAKSELMANMSHELRTPLNAIIGFSDLIISETFGKLQNKEYAEYIDLINNSGRHLLEIINDILDVSAIEAGRVELSEDVVSMSNVISTVTRLINQRAEEGKVSISSEISEDAPDLIADERRVKQIILNLLSNAVKFTPEQGTVTIKYFADKQMRPVLVVEDNGIGMNESELNLALSQFGQVDGGLNRKNEGSGLGLPLTMGLVELHDAQMNIESEKERGTTVSVIFPIERSGSHLVIAQNEPA